MKDNIHQNCILILDFGSQYTKLIARRVREIGVYCEIWMPYVTEEQIREFKPTGIILSGSPMSTTIEGSPLAPNYVFTANVPVLGICYGMQTMVMQLGGKVEKSGKGEFGYAQVKIKTKCDLITNINKKFSINGAALLDVWMSHNDKVTVMPPDFVAIASTHNCPFAIIANEKKRFYGVQFHPEVTYTFYGTALLSRFVKNICRCKQSWIPSNIIEDTVKQISKRVGKDEVILGISGGVDSSVTALLLKKAIGDKLTCVFVDNGLLRLNEATAVLKILRDNLGLKIIHVEAANRFLNALSEIEDPETKRKIIGRVFIEIFNEEAQKLPNVKWLAQGTIYPDVIESVTTVTGKSYIIKSHHNVGGLPKEMQLGLLEPLKELFKDEVRRIGLTLGLPDELLSRHPFPGPGLSIRVLGKVKKEYCDLLRNADAIFIEELRKSNLYQTISQAFSVFLPVKSVGVIGDKRQYQWVVALRAVETVDFMTARWANLPYDFLELVSTRIINEIKGISRVVYDISGKPPATIEWE